MVAGGRGVLRLNFLQRTSVMDERQLFLRKAFRCVVRYTKFCSDDRFGMIRIHFICVYFEKRGDMNDKKTKNCKITNFQPQDCLRNKIAYRADANGVIT